MTVVISDSEYRKAKETTFPVTGYVIDRYTSEQGVHHIVVNFAGGVPSWTEKIVHWGEHTDVKQCLTCGEFIKKHTAQNCFSCAVGRS